MQAPNLDYDFFDKAHKLGPQRAKLRSQTVKACTKHIH